MGKTFIDILLVIVKNFNELLVSLVESYKK